MTLVKYTRKRPVISLYDDMNRLMNNMWGRNWLFDTPTASRWVPAFDIREDKESIVFEAALPGLSKKDIEVTLQDGVLTVSGERKEEEIREDETVHTAELRYGSFSRSFSLPGEVDEENVDAQYKNGILRLALKKLQPIEPERKQIAIK